MGGEVVEDPPDDGAAAGRDRGAALRGPVCLRGTFFCRGPRPGHELRPRADEIVTEGGGVEGDQGIAGRAQLGPRGGDLTLHGRRRVFGGARCRPRRPQRGVGGPDRVLQLADPRQRRGRRVVVRRIPKGDDELAVAPFELLDEPAGFLFGPRGRGLLAATSLRHLLGRLQRPLRRGVDVLHLPVAHAGRR